MKKIKIIVLGILIVVTLQVSNICPLQKVKAAEQSSNEEEFVIKDGVLTKYNGNGGDVVVPEGVVTISAGAFNLDISVARTITSVTLPDSVTTIDSSSFKRCKNLTSINMPASVTSIGDSAFYYCENLVEVTSLDGVTSIGRYAFSGTPWLEEKKKENPIVTVNNVLIDASTCTGNVIIPDTVTQIVGFAFGGSNDITSVTIPGSVTSIGEGAFANCRYLLTVRMEDSVETIGESAFQYCTRLKNVRLSNSIKVIEDWTFANCVRLNKITIPYSVEKVEKTAFRGCKKLKYVTASDKVLSVDEYDLSAFDGCPDIVFYGFEKSYIQSYAEEKNIPFKKIAMAVQNKTLAVKDTYTVKMNSSAVCTWKSSDTSIATVNYYGKVTAKKKGKVTITATLYDKSYTCKLTIK